MSNESDPSMNRKGYITEEKGYLCADCGCPIGDYVEYLNVKRCVGCWSEFEMKCISFKWDEIEEIVDREYGGHYVVPTTPDTVNTSSVSDFIRAQKNGKAFEGLVDDGYERFIEYANRFSELILKQANSGLDNEESLELKEKCRNMIEKINWQNDVFVKQQLQRDQRKRQEGFEVTFKAIELLIRGNSKEEVLNETGLPIESIERIIDIFH